MRIFLSALMAIVGLALAGGLSEAADAKVTIEDGFYLVIDDLDDTTPDTVVVEDREVTAPETIKLARPALVSGKEVKSAAAVIDPSLELPVVTIELTEDGGKQMRDATSRNIGRRIAIVVDRAVVSAPMVRAVMDKELQISSSFTMDEAKAIATRISAHGSN